MSSQWICSPVVRSGGELQVPGDKSVSHRALMLGALAEGRTVVTGFLPGEDCLATLGALRSMGVSIEQPEPTRLLIHGVGLHGLAAPPGPLDMGNSGTAMRLFAGILAAQSFDSVLTGDASLNRRPMTRIAEPLTAMGASIKTQQGRPPLYIRGGRDLHGIEFVMPLASAQVKSAVLLAGLYAPGGTTVIEPAVSRDHTERMLDRLGWPVVRVENSITVVSGGTLTGTDIHVPGDLSSAAFFILAGLLGQGGEVVIDNVGLNPTRTGVLRILELMGAELDVSEHPVETGEPVGRIVARPSRLRGIEVPEEYVPLAIDEFPVIFMAAAAAEGETRISGAGELRHKESDRISVMATGLRQLGIDVVETPDGARITGGRLAGGRIDSGGDHRVAMAFAAASVAARAPIIVADTDNVATSFPGFVEAAGSIGLDLAVTAAND